MEKSGINTGKRLKTNDERINKMINPDKETMVSFLVSKQILETILIMTRLQKILLSIPRQ